MKIPLIDIFAGPGGLGEGFSSFADSAENHPFSIALSIEKDRHAHETLRLRALSRHLPRPTKALAELFNRGAAWKQFVAAFPAQAHAADMEARQLELGPQSASTARGWIANELEDTDIWVLVGGPPCQAYSIVGRSRNKGNAEYVPEADTRQTLYVEYLQILADQAPPVFVMENVKGLLSARLDSSRIFDRIRDDLQLPHRAMQREGRRAGSRRPRYAIHSLVVPGSTPNDSDFVVRSEDYGVPQRRHRVILLGIREDFTRNNGRVLRRSAEPGTVSQKIGDLPTLRSGVSKASDGSAEWREIVQSARRAPWTRQIDDVVVRELQAALDMEAPTSRGSDFMKVEGRVVLNHSTRSHIPADLHRYLFASCYARAHGRSPTLQNFPKALLPRHKNARRALEGGLFADRFRVQLGDEPSTTITSHISKDGHYYIHFDPVQCRSLTVREAARLQTFPDDYFFCGPRTAQYQQVGNAVPPRLARLIARIVHGILTG
jgi:DNA (cytosine-5)-methyltransferase 1